jgi:anti-sigma regulatory factor (Ser/Thr protein kinase)
MAVAASATASHSFPARLECAAEAGTWLRTQAEALRIDPGALYPLEVCLEEVFANLVLHGKATFATVRLAQRAGTAQLEIIDDGALFDPTRAAQQQVSGPLADVQIGGLGIGLIHRFATAITYRRDGDHNHLTLDFALTEPSQNAGRDE